VLPEGARTGGVERDGQELINRAGHDDATSRLRCVTRADGSLDDIATLSRKIDFLWEHPDIRPPL
jgi:hypothetical protein